MVSLVLMVFAFVLFVLVGLGLGLGPEPSPRIQRALGWGLACWVAADAFARGWPPVGR